MTGQPNANDDLVARVVAAIMETEAMRFIQQLQTDPAMMRTYLAANDPEYAAEQERLAQMENMEMNQQPEMFEEGEEFQQEQEQGQEVEQEMEEERPERNARQPVRRARKPVRRKHVRRAAEDGEPMQYARHHIGSGEREDDYDEIEGGQEVNTEEEMEEQEDVEEQYLDPELEGEESEEEKVTRHGRNEVGRHRAEFIADDEISAKHAKNEVGRHRAEFIADDEIATKHARHHIGSGERDDDYDEIEGGQEVNTEEEMEEQEDVEEQYLEPELQEEEGEEEEVTRHARTQMAGGILPKTKLAPGRFRERPLGIPQKPTSNIPMKPSFEPTKKKNAKTSMAPPSIRTHGMPAPKKPTTNVPRSTRMGGTSTRNPAEGRQAKRGQQKVFDESWGRALHEAEPQHFERRGGPIRRDKQIDPTQPHKRPANITPIEYDLEGQPHQHVDNIEADEYDLHGYEAESGQPHNTPPNLKGEDQKVTLSRGGRPVRRAAGMGGSTASGTNSFVPGGVGQSPQSNYEKEEADRYRHPQEIPQMIHNRRKVKRMRTDTTPQADLSIEEVEELRTRLDEALQRTEKLANENHSLRTKMQRLEHNEGILIKNARQRAFRERLARRKADLLQVENEGIVLDLNEEIGEPGEGDAYTMSEQQWERKIEGMRKRYARSPVSGRMPFAPDQLRSANAQQKRGLQSKDQMYEAVAKAKNADGTYDPKLYAAAVNGAGEQ